jgi:hypothetical protein
MSTNDPHIPTPESELPDERDAMLHANLLAVGRRIGPVPSPSAERVRSWRVSGAADAPELRLADASAERPARAPRSRWLAAGSALAACIAIGAVVLIQPWGGAVQASTILDGLRGKMFGGVNLRFDHVSSRGTTVDGVMYVRLDKPVSIDTLDRPRALEGKDRFGAAYGKFTITTDGSVPGWAGGRIEAEGSLTHGNGWMFVRASDRTVAQIAAAEPRAFGIARMAGAGVLLNVGGVDDAFFDGLNAMMCPGGRASGSHAGGDGSPAGAPSIEQMQRFASLARMVLSGKARQGELDQMRGMIQDDLGQKATVTRLDGGRHLLRTDLRDPGAHAAKDRTPDATLTVCYEESGGVQWAELSNMRDAAGTIHIDFVSDSIDPALLNYERLVETGKTNYLDLRQIMRMFMPAPPEQ